MQSNAEYLQMHTVEARAKVGSNFTETVPILTYNKTNWLPWSSERCSLSPYSLYNTFLVWQRNMSLSSKQTKPICTCYEWIFNVYIFSCAKEISKNLDMLHYSLSLHTYGYEIPASTRYCFLSTVSLPDIILMWMKVMFHNTN